MINNSVCCVIVTYNIGEKFYNCFNSIYTQVEQVVIVDNGSTKETLNVLDEISRSTTAKVIYNNENLGIAAALNKGIKFAEKNNYEWVLTMDNDSVSTEGMVEAMLNTYSSISDDEKSIVATIFPNYIEMGIASVKEEQVKSDKKPNGYEYIKVEVASGNLVRTEVFNKVGYFKEELFIDLVDNDFCFRVLELGLKHIKAYNAVLLHSLGESRKKKLLFVSITSTNHSYIRRYYITRNRLYIWRRYKNIVPEIISEDKVVFIREIIKIMLLENDKYKKLKMIKKGYKDFKNNKFGPLAID